MSKTWSEVDSEKLDNTWAGLWDVNRYYQAAIAITTTGRVYESLLRLALLHTRVHTMAIR